MHKLTINESNGGHNGIVSTGINNNINKSSLRAADGSNTTTDRKVRFDASTDCVTKQHAVPAADATQQLSHTDDSRHQTAVRDAVTSVDNSMASQHVAAVEESKTVRHWNATQSCGLAADYFDVHNADRSSTAELELD